MALAVAMLLLPAAFAAVLLLVPNTHAGCMIQPDANGHVSVADSTKMTAIPARAFSGCKALKSIAIGCTGHLVAIGNNAFDGAVNLKVVTFATNATTTTTATTATVDSVRKRHVGRRLATSTRMPTARAMRIGAHTHAMGGAPVPLASAQRQTNRKTLSGGAAGAHAGACALATIGNYAFRGCSSLQAIVIPATVTAIQDGAFDSCPTLKTLASTYTFLRPGLICTVPVSCMGQIVCICVDLASVPWLLHAIPGCVLAHAEY